ncbi:MAG: scyllo-inositol 2-dehydrogenase (NAD(+)) [Candidatus Moanabacter tarae]|uniref:Scyllo-inositol 2-dehydrogenase (NAD(+)) n=1 Tax=Candidatus Moanibacter tarae TaxID=2200854 RepID=A0A2Z4ABK4_9BACT|nr:MAG: scyllo-inositol 2-dehydrogenase (NAD(+)) [Candidatus Moanabacter tarae]
MTSNMDKLQIGIYGAGGHCVNQHLPNLNSFGDVEIVAICDINKKQAQKVATDFGIPSYYTDGLKMLKSESIDALWSLVAAGERPDVEITAAKKGVHLFCDKPQTLDMKDAIEIDEALQQSGALGTVCFRERYRPLWQEAKRLLKDKNIVHIRFQSFAGLPSKQPNIDTPGWDRIIENHADFLGWGPHAIDYCRFVSGLEIVTAQAFFCSPARYHVPLSASYNFALSNDATMTMTFVQTSEKSPQNEPYFLFYYEGGYLAVHQGYSGIEMNGDQVFQATEFQPWRELDRIFVNAIQTGDTSYLLNDFHDGLKTLAPLLAGWESARNGGSVVDVPSYMNQFVTD